MITLGLDPSLTGFGWCVHDSSATGPARIVARGHYATDPDAVFVTRYMTLRTLVADLLTEHPQIQAVGVESPPFGAQWTPGLYGLFLFVYEAVYTARKDVVHFDPTTLKMLVKMDSKKNKAKMTKAAMVAAARVDTGLVKGKFNHNEADAYHLARFAARFWDTLHGNLTQKDLTPSEQQAFLYVHKTRAGACQAKGAVYKEGERFYRFSQVP